MAEFFCWLIDSNKENKTKWKYPTITPNNLKAIFPDAPGTIIRDGEDAILVSSDGTQLEIGKTYTIPVSKATSNFPPNFKFPEKVVQLSDLPKERFNPNRLVNMNMKWIPRMDVIVQLTVDLCWAFVACKTNPNTRSYGY